MVTDLIIHSVEPIVDYSEDAIAKWAESFYTPAE